MRIEPQISIRRMDTNASTKPVMTRREDETLNDRQDTSSISSSGAKLQKAFSRNKSNAVLGLESQKEKIAETKKEFLERAKTTDMDSKEIAERVKEFDEQISAIDQQISQLKIEEQKKATGIDEEDIEKAKEKQASNPNKTDEQIEKQQAQNFVNLSQGIDNVKSAMSLRQKLSDTAKVIERQIASDIGTGSGTSIYSDMLKEVNVKIAELSIAIGESMNELEGAVKNQNKQAASQGNEKTDENKEENTNENTNNKIETKTATAE